MTATIASSFPTGSQVTTSRIVLDMTNAESVTLNLPPTPATNSPRVTHLRSVNIEGSSTVTLTISIGATPVYTIPAMSVGSESFEVGSLFAQGSSVTVTSSGTGSFKGFIIAEVRS
jgi:hypothetical protein